MKIKISKNKKNIIINIVTKIIYILFVAGATYSVLNFYPLVLAKAPIAAVNKAPVAVDAIKLKSQTFDDFEELPGRTSAYRFAEVRPQVDGIIIKRFFTEGSKVKKGQQLYQIDPAQYLANYNSAKADLQKSQANLETIKAKSVRYKKLVEVDAVSKQEYDDVVASLGQAIAEVAISKAALDKSKIYLNYTKVLAPITGRISKSLVTEGSLVSANQAQILTTITQLDPIFVDIERSSEDLTQFQDAITKQKKVPVELYLSNGEIYKHKGFLQFSEVNVDPSTSSVGIRALFKNPDQTLLPGSFVKVHIKTSSSSAILIPEQAAVRGQDGSLSVWIIDDKNQANPKPIKASKAVGNQWLVTEGLKDNDVIVVEGFQKIAPGATVAPTFLSETAKITK